MSITSTTQASQTTQSSSEETQSFEMPPFLQTAGRVVKFVMAVIAGIAGIGALAIAITLTPFNPHAGAAAFAATAALFTASGALFYSALSAPYPNTRAYTHIG